MQRNPMWEKAGRPKVRYSAIEVRHLVMAVLLLSIAFMFVASTWKGLFFGAQPRDLAAIFTWEVVFGSLLAVSSGFVFHELAHKFAAQRYGHWAEFRAEPRNLGLSILVALAFKFIFAMPGAVRISGNVTPKENGIISLVGPLVNMLIAGIALPFGFAVNPDEGWPAVARTVALVNAFLAVFNLLPFWVLDGRKVRWWSPTVHTIALVAALALLVVTLLFASPPA